MSKTPIPRILLAQEGRAIDEGCKNEYITALQRALAFWLPNVPDEDSARAERIADDAMLLMCYDGPDEASAEDLGWWVMAAL